MGGLLETTGVQPLAMLAAVPLGKRRLGAAGVVRGPSPSHDAIASPAAAGGSPCGCPLYISGPGHPAGTLATGGAHHGPPLEAWLRVESGS